MSLILERTEMRVLPALISFILLIIFIVPFFKRIVNFGNCFGTLFSAVLTVFFVFNRQCTEALSAAWEKTFGRALLIMGAVFLAAGAALAVLISVLMLRAAGKSPIDTDTTLVVLGCKVKGNRPSRMLKRRLDTAFDYLSANGEVKVIVSGGKGSDEQISEAQCMREYLIGRGISSERIFMEDKSSSTYENLRFSKELTAKNGLPSAITIVTDGYHQLRSGMIAKSLGIKAWSISAPTSVWLIPTYWVREWFGIIHQFVS